MQRLVSTGLAAASILLASVRVLSSGAHAMAAGDATLLHAEATIPNAAKPIDKVACWGWAGTAPASMRVPWDCARPAGADLIITVARSMVRLVTSRRRRSSTHRHRPLGTAMTRAATTRRSPPAPARGAWRPRLPDGRSRRGRHFPGRAGPVQRARRRQGRTHINVIARDSRMRWAESGRVLSAIATGSIHVTRSGGGSPPYLTRLSMETWPAGASLDK